MLYSILIKYHQHHEDAINKSYKQFLNNKTDVLLPFGGGAGGAVRGLTGPPLQEPVDPFLL